ncbi:MAG: sigma-70 family RNA polymerase sigma factor [Kiritimatiellae bacterium]|nr:sigma-70 family RNA polymerase sigma factor [Kiritimatiellia bacterium]
MNPAMCELAEAQFALFSYICMMTGNSQDARDILQETNLRICREIERYDPSRPFMAWARTIAFFEVRTHRKKMSRERLVFDDDVFEMISAETENKSFEVTRRLAVLDGCIRKLPEMLRQVVKSRYLNGVPVKTIAAQLKRSPNAVSLLLMRARQALADCVLKAVGKELFT